MPVPEPRLAVDLSGGLIRVLEGQMGGPMLSASAVTPAGAIVDGRVVDPSVVGTSLRQLLARGGISETRALVAASDALATSRVLKFPEATTDASIDAAVAKELPLDPSRMATRWFQVRVAGGEREVYATAWDRDLVKNITEAVRLAGLDPVVVDLKSGCVARAVSEPTCVVVDLTCDPAEIVLIDGGVPHVWQSVHADGANDRDLAVALANPLRTVLKFHMRRRNADFARSRVFISAEQTLAGQVMSRLSELVEHPVEPLPIPTRVPSDIRHATYLTCLGLLMRRTR